VLVGDGVLVAAGCGVLVGDGVLVAAGFGVLVGDGVGVAVGAEVSVGTAVGDGVATGRECVCTEVRISGVVDAVTTGCGVTVGVSAGAQP